jgi:hypothetical protein
MQDELLKNELIQLCVCVCVCVAAFQGVHGSLETDKVKKRYDDDHDSDKQLTFYFHVLLN